MSALLRVLILVLVFLIALTGIISLLNGHLGLLELVLTAALAAGAIAVLLAARRRLA
jgi:hypothetical protein